MEQHANTQLRYGWTTGACATAATKAAFLSLVTGEQPQEVCITLPRGETPVFTLVFCTPGCATVEKDAGDDPDVTHGAHITSTVRFLPKNTGIVFTAGNGVGTITKAGLPIAVGEAAINPVPRQMMQQVIHEVAQQHSVLPDVDICISVKNGAELAKKTWNPRLGIEGGISILGTTGIVRPFSCAAWIASIHRGVDVARANGLTHVVGATGATSEKAAQELYGLPDIAMLDMGDFLGGLLKYIRTHPVQRLTIAGGFAKMTKAAQGAIDLHSKRTQVDFGILAQWAGDVGCDPARVKQCNTALEALTLCGAPLADVVADKAHAAIRDRLRGAPVVLEVLIVNRTGHIVARQSDTA